MTDVGRSAAVHPATPRPEFFTTLHLPLRAEWMRRADVLDPAGVSHFNLLRQVMRAASDYDIIVLNGSRHLEQALAALIALRHPSRHIIITDCTWEVGSRIYDRATARAAVRAINRGDVTYCVLSTEERRLFPGTWGVEPSRVIFTPWCYTLSNEELSLPVTDGGFVFAGGDSMRDYLPLIQASRGLDVPVKIAARRCVSSGDHSLPANVTAGPTTHRHFIELMASATVVVVPMEARDDRSAGQSTYLNPMALGKPVIVSDVMGARDYIDPGRTGLIVPPGDGRAMRAALDWVLSDENRSAVRDMGARAQEVVRARFGPEAYVASLLRAVEAAASR